jgi:hypothetical protein
VLMFTIICMNHTTCNLVVSCNHVLNDEDRSIRSQYRIPNYYISLCVLLVIALSTLGMIQVNKYRKYCIEENAKASVKKIPKTAIAIDVSINMMKELSCKTGIQNLVENETHQHFFARLDFWTQLKLLTSAQFEAYRPECVNILRIFEVSTLGLLVGLLFYDVGNKQSGESLGQKTGLLFFSVTLWTFTRMYPAVGSTSAWYRLAIDFSKAFENETLKM